MLMHVIVDQNEADGAAYQWYHQLCWGECHDEWPDVTIVIFDECLLLWWWRGCV